ncbi:MAG: terminase gpA endonuclease subunit [Planctomycetota bacterium]
MTVSPLWAGRRGEAFTYPKRVRVSEWADENLFLPPDSAEAGSPYRTARTPYGAEWMDSIGRGWVRQITVVASTQVGKTQAMINMMAYATCRDPGPSTLVMPSKEAAVEFCENKIRPAMEVSPTWRGQLTDRRFDSKQRQIQLRRSRILFRSAVNPQDLASYPARWLFADECDKWPAKARGEAPPFNLARERTRTFPNHCIVIASTPTDSGSLIIREFEKGDQRRYHVPCPHCGTYQVLKLDQIKWPEDIADARAMKERKKAWYECESCAKPINDEQKRTQLLPKGVWCPKGVTLEDHLVDGRLELDERNPHRSYHIWAAYSPFLTWWEIAAEYLSAKGTPEYQNFVNSWLAEVYVDRTQDTRIEVIKECVGGYNRGDVPEGVLVVTGGVDVQKRFLAYSLTGWGPKMESWLLDHGRVDDFSDLEAILFHKPWPGDVRIAGVFVDANYRQNDVIDFARKHRGIVHMCSGQEYDDPVLWKPRKVERHPRTGQPIGMQIWGLNVGMFKDHLADSIENGEPGDRGYHLYQEVDQQFLREMTSEHKVSVVSKTKTTDRWVKKTAGSQNHFWDTQVYNVAMAHRLGVHKLDAAAVARKPRRERRSEGRRGARGGLGLDLFGGGSA